MSTATRTYGGSPMASTKLPPLTKPQQFRTTTHATYSATLMPYLGRTEGDVMAPHPLSQTRTNAESLMDEANRKSALTTLKDIQRETTWFPNRHSCTFRPLSTKTDAVEYKSFNQMDTDRSKHVRSAKGPEEKVQYPLLTSHDLGWSWKKALERNRGPTHGIQESFVTKYFHNMEITKSYHVLRFAR
mmetsp:Transcript_34407/g.68021  ORF Transcript_34407/g.68021 Transcript_34407/m.68021 type:complete len:187 (+) Transcript_34407:98-658(+)